MLAKFLVPYLTWIAVLSLFTFFAYGWDKRQAKAHGSRIAEKHLLLLALLGGWPGALASQHVFRHKTKKTSFQVGFWFCVVVHIVAIYGLGRWMAS